MKKIKIIAYEEDRTRLVRYLQDKGLIQIISTKEFPTLEEISISTLDLKENLENIKEALEFLKAHLEDSQKVFLIEEEFESLIDRFNYSEFLKKVKEIKKEIEELNSSKERLSNEHKNLILWKNLDLPLEELSPTLYTESLLGLLPKKRFTSFLKEVGSLNIYLKVIDEDKLNKYILITYLIEDREDLSLVFRRNNFNIFTLPQREKKITDVLRDIKFGIDQIEKRLSSLKESLKELAKERHRLMAIYDWFSNIKESFDIQKNFKRTESVFYIEGWIRKKDIEFLKKDLNSNFKEIEIFISEPLPKEIVPVALENKKPFRTFEVVTELYGKPLYGWIDPTPYLAIFFCLSLAFCLTDAGYGLLLALGSFFALKKLKLKNVTRKFLRLFFICGLLTVVTGGITGSWFGNLLDKSLFLKTIKDKFVLFDPLKEPLNFLFLSLGLGFLQIIFGLFLRFFKGLKNKLYFHAFFRDFPSILLQISLLIFVLGFFKIFPKNILPFAGLAFLFSSLLIIFYQFKTQREFILKIFWSIYGLYAIIAGNFLADTLSFCRIFALGLATSLLATAINEIYLILPGILRTILIPGFIFAHLLNLGINLLGAYVHTSRLQYLEFFTKFFESQEEGFKPFKREFEFVEIK